MTLTRDELLAGREAPREKVHVPTIGGDVWVLMMSGAERRDFMQENHRLGLGAEDAGWRTYPWRLLERVLCDEQGERLLQPGDGEALAEQPGVDLDECFEVACRLNRLLHHGITEAAGKSEGTPSSEPSTGSASPSESPESTDS